MISLMTSEIIHLVNLPQLWNAYRDRPLGCGPQPTQFRILAEQGLERPDLASDPRFSTNDARVAHRAELVKIISDALMQEDGDYWLQQLTGLG